MCVAREVRKDKYVRFDMKELCDKRTRDIYSSASVGAHITNYKKRFNVIHIRI